MGSIARPFLYGILCFVAALGHSPAWLHVSTCGSHETCGHCVVASSISVDTQAAGCCQGCHHETKEQASSLSNCFDVAIDEHSHHATGHSPDPTGHEHNDETCAICQSLSAPSGVRWKLDVPLATSVCEERGQLLSSRRMVAAFQLVKAPRGPPVIA